MQTQIKKTLLANQDMMRQHLEFLFSGMKEYEDCRIEISILNRSDTFTLSEIDKAISRALSWNAQGENVYTVGAALNPDMFPASRSCDEDFYASSVVWCDIDDPIDKEELKKLYAHCPPNAAVITAHVPNRRLQLWWKLDEPLTDTDALREALQGVQEALRGDPKVKNITSLMRLGGGVNIPTEKKQAGGRIVEVTEYHNIHNNKTSIENFIRSYPIKSYFDPLNSTPAPKTTIVSSGGLSSQIIDGREQYMSDMVYAAIINLAGELRRWPTPQEVYDDAWPVYSAKVGARGQRTLDQDHRGGKAMQQKIISKLRLITAGRVRSAPTLDSVLRNAPKKGVTGIPETENVDPTTGEVNRLSYKWIMADDVQAVLEVQDFVEDTLRDGEMSVVYGRPGCGKTFFMVDLAMHVALGRKWNGLEVEQGAAVYVSMEGAHGMKNRVHAFRSHHAIEGKIPLYIIPQAFSMFDQQIGLQGFLNTLEDIKTAHGSIRLIVIDTLARAMAGGDENSTKDMSLFVSSCDIVRGASKAHIAIVHHSGKDELKGGRGSSALLGGIDTEIELSRDEDSNIVTVTTTKQKEMELGKKLYYSISSVILGVNKRGKSVTSCVVYPVDEDVVTKTKDTREMSPKQKFIYEVIVNQMTRVGEKRRPYNDGPELVCISYEDLKEGLENAGVKRMLDSENGKSTAEDKVKSFTQSGREQLKKMGKIGFNKRFVWILDGE